MSASTINFKSLFTTNPLTPSSITSRFDPTSVATTGNPANCASINATGIPSLSLVDNTTSTADHIIAASAQPITFTFAGAASRTASNKSPPPAITNKVSGNFFATSNANIGFLTDVMRAIQPTITPASFNPSD